MKRKSERVRYFVNAIKLETHKLNEHKSREVAVYTKGCKIF